MTRTYSAIESTRLDLQAALDSAKTREERNRLGQFATPTELAREMLVYARTVLDDEAPVRFLDPAFGTGSFYSALLELFPCERIADAAGFEIDPHYGAPAAALWENTGLRLRLEDFTFATPPATDAERHNLVICNPPYVRHHHLDPADKARLRVLSERASGVRIGGLAGLYCHFLALAHTWMADDALAGWLIPSEFMDVGYGEAVKQYLLDRVTLLHIHRFDPDATQFKDALVSSSVVWFRNRKPAVDDQVRFTFGGTLTEPKHSKAVSASVLRTSPKWTRYPLNGDAQSDVQNPTLGDLFTVKRGLATGDNEFFILRRDEIKQRGLPMECFRPVLPSPRNLNVDVIESDDAGNPRLDPPLFLLNCRLPEEVVCERFPSLWDYLQEGRSRGIHERYLCRHRAPWYAQEDRPPSPFLCTYMGRKNGRSAKPFRFILNRSQATVTNVYLVLYPKPWLVRELDAMPHLARTIWRTLNDITSDVLTMNGRVYGGGLHKLEPKELMGVGAGTILANLPNDRQPIRPAQLELALS